MRTILQEVIVPFLWPLHTFYPTSVCKLLEPTCTGIPKEILLNTRRSSIHANMHPLRSQLLFVEILTLILLTTSTAILQILIMNQHLTKELKQTKSFTTRKFKRNLATIWRERLCLRTVFTIRKKDIQTLQHTLMTFRKILITSCLLRNTLRLCHC